MEIFVSQDVANDKLNALIVHYQAKGDVKHMFHNLPNDKAHPHPQLIPI